MKKPLLLVSVSLVGLLAGCQTPPPRTVQTFCVPPEGWTDLGGREVPLSVEQCHLSLTVDRVLLDPTAFSSVNAIVDMAFTGGDPRGVAGLTLWNSAGEQRSFYSLALRPSGEWRVYRASDPRQPVGGRGWQPLSRETAAGFVRLGARVIGGAVQFYVDGSPVDSYPLEQPAALVADDPGQGALYLGIFSQDATTRWKNFVAGESTAAGEFRPEEEAYWGADNDAGLLMDQAAAAARVFRSRPGRMGLFEVVASLDEAKRILLALGGQAGVEGLKEHARGIEEYMTPGASRIREEELLKRSFHYIYDTRHEGGDQAAQLVEAARDAESRGLEGTALCLYLAAATRGADPAVEESIERLKADLEPLRLDYRLENRAEDPIFNTTEFWNVVRENYGGLRSSREGELKIHVGLRRSANEAETSRGTRRVPVYLRGQGNLGKLLEERDKLRSELPDDLLDARARANVIRTSAEILGPSVLAELRKFEFGGKTYELALGDGRALEAAYSRLKELEEQIREEESHESVAYREVPATLHTNSIVVEFSVLVALGDRELMRIQRARSYLGIEQWTHPASPDLGLEASRYRQDVVEDAIRAVKARALRRFRAAVSIETILPKLEPDERVRFLIRFGRSSALPEVQASLEWFLQEELGITGDLREEVVESCFE